MPMTLERVLRELRSRFPLSPWQPCPIPEIIGQENVGKMRLKPEIKLALEKAIMDRNDQDVASLLNVADVDGLDATYSKVFRDLLQADFHREHEEVVTALEEVKDPATVQVLYDTALRVPDWDDGRSLAKKCISALKAIGTGEARQRLRDLSESDDWIIREFARDISVD